MLPQTDVNNAYFNTTNLYTRPIFVNEISSPPYFNDCIALLYISSDQCIQPDDGLTRRGRNMQLAETFVYTLTPSMLQL